MENLLRYIGGIFDKSSEHRKWFQGYGIERPDPFLSIIMRMRLSLVILDVFWKHWEKPVKDDLAQGQLDIIHMIGRDAFVSSFSGLEFASKVYVKDLGNADFLDLKERIKKQENDERVQRVYLISIMDRSKT